MQAPLGVVDRDGPVGVVGLQQRIQLPRLIEAGVVARDHEILEGCLVDLAEVVEVRADEVIMAGCLGQESIAPRDMVGLD